MPGRVERGVPVIAQANRLAVGDGTVDARLVGIEPPRVDPERLRDVGDVADVIRVRVGHHDGVEAAGPVFDPAHDVEVVAGVDQDRALARHEKGVAGERLDPLCEVRNHGREYGGCRFVCVELWRVGAS